MVGLRIFEDDLFTLDHSDACSVPGYLILRLRAPALSMADLDADAAGRLGLLIGRAIHAIEATVMADRVYVLSFCEIDRRLHFHLFPRTQRLLSEYWEQTGTSADPINGPALFEWARRSPEPVESPAGEHVIAGACAALRANFQLPPPRGRR